MHSRDAGNNMFAQFMTLVWTIDRHIYPVLFLGTFPAIAYNELPVFEAGLFLPRSKVIFAPKLGHICSIFAEVELKCSNLS